MTGEAAEIEVAIAPEEAGERLDRLLARRLPDLSRSRVQALIADGRVSARGPAGEPLALDAASGARAGVVVRVSVPPPEPAVPEAQPIPLDVVFEDEHLIVIDKPAGLVVHPGAGHADQTLVNALLAHCGESLAGIGGVARPGIVHRLDKDTTGLLVAAKTERAHADLVAQLAARTVERAYLALVWGVPPGAVGVVEGDIGRDPRDRRRMAVVRRGGRTAVTHWRALRALGLAASLVECRLETGRTHQIRVHMTHVGHPIVGDPVYGRATRARMARLGSVAQDAVRGFPRQALHAAVLGFVHPVTGAALRFERPPPDDMAALIVALGRETDRQEGIETSR